MTLPDRPFTIVSRAVPSGTTIEFRPSPDEILHISAPIDGRGLVVTEQSEYDDETGRHVRETSIALPDGQFATNIRGDNKTIYSYTRVG